MKRIGLTITALAFVFSGMAQDKYVTSALSAVKEKNYEEAKADIDRAAANPESKDKPKTLFAKAQVYFSLIPVDKYKDSDPWKEGTQALLKLVEVKPDYEKEDVNVLLMYGAGLYFNNGISAYNAKKNDQAIELLKNTIKIHDLGGGKRFEKFPRGKLLDTMSARAELTIARCAYFSQKYDEAILAFNKLKKNPITKSVENYNILLDAYDKYNTNNGNKLTADELAAIQDAMAENPSDANIRAFEVNYYIKNNKLTELVKRMEDATVKEPSNASLQLTLAMTYQGIANPKDGSKPANAAEYLAKAETALLAAVKLAPEDANINYNTSTIYFNQAAAITDQMNQITGTTAADNAKYADLQKKRNAAFDKAEPYLKKSYDVLSAKPVASLNTDDKETYRATLRAMKQLYGAENKTDKLTEVKNKEKELDAAN